jgi:hypothetical protein
MTSGRHISRKKSGEEGYHKVVSGKVSFCLDVHLLCMYTSECHIRKSALLQSLVQVVQVLERMVAWHRGPANACASVLLVSHDVCNKPRDHIDQVKCWSLLQHINTVETCHASIDMGACCVWCSTPTRTCATFITRGCGGSKLMLQSQKKTQHLQRTHIRGQQWYTPSISSNRA